MPWQTSAKLPKTQNSYVTLAWQICVLNCTMSSAWSASGGLRPPTNSLTRDFTPGPNWVLRPQTHTIATAGGAYIAPLAGSGVGPTGNGKEGWQGKRREGRGEEGTGREGRASRNAQIQSWQAYSQTSTPYKRWSKCTAEKVRGSVLQKLSAEVHKLLMHFP